MAREEAVQLRHQYVAPEHILLALLRDGEGVAAAALANFEVDADALGARVKSKLREGRSGPPVGPDLPYSTHAKKVLEFAMTEARELNHSYVGTEHLLLGLLREEKGIAAEVLNQLGATLEEARRQT